MMCEKGLRYPCGKCAPCLEKKRQEWAYRCKQETLGSHSSHVVTLTYNDVYNPLTLVKEDLQKFVKRVRSHKEYLLLAKTNNKTEEVQQLRRSTNPVYDLPVRYYGVGEYGTKTQRPHYHIILWNLPKETIDKIPDLWGKYDRENKKTDPFGMVYVDELNDAAITYVLKYLITKPDWDNKDVRLRPFSIMSRRPGIGSRWLEYNGESKKEYIRNANGSTMAVPQFYKNKMGLETNPEKQLEVAESIREQNKRHVAALHKFENPTEEKVKRYFENNRMKLSKINKNDKL